jgi:hypothetical protein
MKIVKPNNNINLILNSETDYQTNLGWSESFVEFETDALRQVTNNAENYETVRYIHKPYSGITSNQNLLQTDIWFYFYFISGNTYVQNYEATELTNEENAKMLAQATRSFFRLEFYKTIDNEPPSRINRKLVFAKNLVLTSGERFYYTKDQFNDYIYLPVFTGNNYRNKENMYIFWFQDNTPYETTPYSGNTFWVTAKYLNAKNGDILDFTNNCFSQSHEIVEINDLYYQMDVDMVNYTFQIYEYDGVKGDRVGTKNNPIKFYEKGGATC